MASAIGGNNASAIGLFATARCASAEISAISGFQNRE